MFACWPDDKSEHLDGISTTVRESYGYARTEASYRLGISMNTGPICPVVRAAHMGPHLKCPSER